MATYTDAFDTYEVFYYSDPTTPATYAGVIQVYNAGVFAGQIAFVHDGNPIPKNSLISPFGQLVPSIHYFLSQFDSVIGILRREKPLYLYLDDMNWVGMIATSAPQTVGS